MEIQKQCQKRGIENGVEAPTPEPGASVSGEVIVEHPTWDRKAEHELHNLEIRDQALPPRPHPDGAQ